MLIYNITVKRAWQPYARGYILTQVMLNLVGFSAFWLPPTCGERMSLSISAMLAALFSGMAVSAKVPAASDVTWFSKFSILSLVFAFVSLLESVAVVYFYYNTRKDLGEWTVGVCFASACLAAGNADLFQASALIERSPLPHPETNTPKFQRIISSMKPNHSFPHNIFSDFNSACMVRLCKEMVGRRCHAATLFGSN